VSPTNTRGQLDIVPAKIAIAFWLMSLTLIPTTIDSVRQLLTIGCLNSDFAA